MNLLHEAETAPDGEGAPNLSRAEKREVQSARVLDAAKACFLRKGFQGASMHDICAEAQMSPGALYRYFPSKEAIIEAISEGDRREHAAILTSMFKTENVVDGVIGAAMAHMHHVHSCGTAALISEIKTESMRNDAVRLTCERTMGEVAKGFAAYVGAAMARGDIDPIAPLPAVLPALMAMGEGLVMEDLPSKGVPSPVVETIMRAVAVAVLRPRTAPEKPS